MSFNQETLREITFMVKEKDEEVIKYKLDKIGVDIKQLRVKTFPPSTLRNTLIVEAKDKDHIKCINCNHWKASHTYYGGTEETHIIGSCYGLIDNENCNCKKFISVY